MNYFDEQMVRTRNNIQETIADVSFLEAQLFLPSRQCPHCTHHIHNVQGLGVNQRVHHRYPDRSTGVRLRRALVSSGVTTIPLSWDGNAIGRWWRVRFHHKTTGIDPACRVAGTVGFDLQPISKSDQGIIANDFTPEPLKNWPGACRATSRRSHTYREKTSAITGDP